MTAQEHNKMNEEEIAEMHSKLAAQSKSWEDGSLLEPKMLKIYQTIIDDGMEHGLGMMITSTCNLLIHHGACTPYKPRQLPPKREE